MRCNRALPLSLCLALMAGTTLAGCQPGPQPSILPPENTVTQTATNTNTNENTNANDNTNTDTTQAKPAGKGLIENFKALLQLPEMPAGCEVTSLTMVLNHLGYTCTNELLADNYLPTGTYGDDMFNKMIGSVYSDEGLGCYAGAIVTCAEDYAKAIKADYTVEDISGATLDEYCALIDAGYPVIVWATENMEETYPYIMWTYNGKETGYKMGEHCLVMIGYDIENDTVTMADPLQGEMTYSLETFFQRNQDMYQQAVVIKQ